MQNQPSFTITRNSISLSIDNKPYIISSGHPNYTLVRKAIIDQAWDKVKELVDIPKAIVQFSQKNLEVKNGQVFYKGEVLSNYVATKLLEWMREGLPYQPLANFIQNLMENPSRTAVEELYKFLEVAEMPITPDGHFLAYRKVRHDFKDFYTGKIDNSVGAKPKMDRNKVDEDRNRTCSNGLHFCSLSYLPHYHGGDGKVVLVKVNPAHVVTIPADYNNAKGRCSEYEVLSVVEGHEAGQSFKNPHYYTEEVDYTTL